MPMKNLTLFRKFDVDGFFADKDLAVFAIKDWNEYVKDSDNKQGAQLGYRVTLMITRDDTDYYNDRYPDRAGQNQFEKFDVKVPLEQYDHSLRKGDAVRLVDVEKANPYGDYMDKLSVTGGVEKIAAQQTQQEDDSSYEAYEDDEDGYEN